MRTGQLPGKRPRSENQRVTRQALSEEGCQEGQETPDRFTFGVGVGRQEISEKDRQGF